MLRNPLSLFVVMGFFLFFLFCFVFCFVWDVVLFLFFVFGGRVFSFFSFVVFVLGCSVLLLLL